MKSKTVYLICDESYLLSENLQKIPGSSARQSRYVLLSPNMFVLGYFEKTSRCSLKMISPISLYISDPAKVTEFRRCVRRNRMEVIAAINFPRNEVENLGAAVSSYFEYLKKAGKGLDGKLISAPGSSAGLPIMYALFNSPETPENSEEFKA